MSIRILFLRPLLLVLVPLTLTLAQAQSLSRAAGGGIDAGASDSDSALEASGPLGQFQSLLESPVVRKLGRLIANRDFTQSADQLLQHPGRMTLLYCEIALLLFMYVFRAWRFSKSTHWAGRLWTNFYSGVAFWGLSSIALPRIVLGESYFRMLGAVIETLKS